VDHATPRRINSDESESTNGQSGQAAVVTYPVPYSSKYVTHILAPRSLTYKQKYAPIAEEESAEEEGDRAKPREDVL